MKPYYYKVRYGYAPMQFASVEAGPDLERIIYAWGEKIPVTIDGKMIHGRSILTIEPHYAKYTGWHETYEPKDAEDLKQIARDCPPEMDAVLSAHNQFVALAGENTALIGTGKAMEQVVLQLAEKKS